MPTGRQAGRLTGAGAKPNSSLPPSSSLQWSRMATAKLRRWQLTASSHILDLMLSNKIDKLGLAAGRLKLVGAAPHSPPAQERVDDCCWQKTAEFKALP